MNPNVIIGNEWGGLRVFLMRGTKCSHLKGDIQVYIGVIMKVGKSCTKIGQRSRCDMGRPEGNFGVTQFNKDFGRSICLFFYQEGGMQSLKVCEIKKGIEYLTSIVKDVQEVSGYLG